MAKVSIKSEKVTPFGGIFHVRELFSRYMAPIIDKVLGGDCVEGDLLASPYFPYFSIYELTV